MIYGTVRVRIDSESLSFVIPNMGLIMCIFGSFAKISMGEVLENEGGGGRGGGRWGGPNPLRARTEGPGVLLLFFYTKQLSKTTHYIKA